MAISRHYLVSGRVQGVGFRQFTVAAAQKERLTGFVENCTDGRVRALAIGEEFSLARFESLIREGPMGSIVKEVEVTECLDSSSYDNFFILESD
tara:strand:+ start:1384 stop:1665 length:282 start_codon:yes stop_codon:yes gene_type:complete